MPHVLSFRYQTILLTSPGYAPNAISEWDDGAYRFTSFLSFSCVAKSKAR